MRPKTHKVMSIRYYFLDFLLLSDILLSAKEFPPAMTPRFHCPGWGWAKGRSSILKTPTSIKHQGLKISHLTFTFFLRSPAGNQFQPKHSLHTTELISTVLCVYLKMLLKDMQIIIKLLSQLPNKHTDSISHLDKHPSIKINDTVKLEGNSKIYSN